MKTSTIILALFSPTHDAQAMDRLCGRYKSDVETSQKVTYCIADGVATITALEPVIATRVNLPLPFCVPVNDLGSGLLNRVDVNIDTLTAYPATCPTQRWASRRALAQPLSVPQTLMADYIGLL